MTISLCMIVKDEEEVLSRCLDSARGLSDEIVIVDTGSRDGTVEIARRYTDRIFFFPWQMDFAAARNFAFSKGMGDYLLWLDADDVLPSKGAFAPLRELLAKEAPDVLLCPYETSPDEKGQPALSFYRERFLRRERGFRWQGRVHECISPEGKVLRSPFPVLHLGSKKERGTRNLDIYRKWEKEEELSGRDLFYYGRELFYHGFYREAEEKLVRMLEGEGWYVNRIEACRFLALARERLQDREGAKTALLSSLRYAEPRASVLCELARLFKEEGRYREAIFWYQSALACRDHSEEGDLEEARFRSLTPLLELVGCYYALGARREAELCHKKTEELAPSHPSVVYNRRFFSREA